MWRSKRLWILLLLAAFTALALILLRVRRDGFSTRNQPSALETFAARQVRHWSMPPSMRDVKNPVPDTPENLEAASHHWADHCATCHANNGSGDTPIGKNLYPKAPDMRQSETQSMTDGELYYTIRNGVRLTGMPAWGDPDAGVNDKESWMLVSFIRHLPKMTPEEETGMKKFNPKTAEERDEESAEEEFLEGKAPAPAKTDHHH